MTPVEQARRWFAEDLRVAAPVVRDPRVVEAFATVPREAYLGPGPWQMHARLGVGTSYESASDDPRHLYHDLLVTIDGASGINNGLPSLWARVFDALALPEGGTVLQVGAGVGYFTAVLAELVGPKGRVLAFEIEDDLAERARANTAHLGQVEIRAGNGALTRQLPELDAAVACAGVTHVPPVWLDNLRPEGRLVVPLTKADGWGILLHLTKGERSHPVRSLGPVGFYPCAGARDAEEEAALARAFALPGAEDRLGAYHRGVPGSEESALMVGQGFWISEAYQ